MNGKRKCAYTTEYYSAIKLKRNEILSTWMKLEAIILSKIRQAQKNKHPIILKGKWVQSTALLVTSEWRETEAEAAVDIPALGVGTTMKTSLQAAAHEPPPIQEQDTGVTLHGPPSGHRERRGQRGRKRKAPALGG
jgi:hypothetical protein